MRAGRVVAEVAVRWVDRKSVMVMNGSSNMLHLVVNWVTVSMISSNDLCCGAEVAVLDGFPLCLSPVLDFDDSGEYLLEYIPSIKNTTALIGVA